MRLPFIAILLLLFTLHAGAQTIAPRDLRTLRAKEDTLLKLSEQLVTDTLMAGRMRSDSLFIRTLVRTLQVPHSFWYPFDSLKGISKLYAPDTSFRIFTWSLDFDGYYARQRGAIQMRTKDGSLKLFPLRDYSEFTEHATDSVRGKESWIGAVYYNIIKTSHAGKAFYTLFGIDAHSVRSKKKWIEVLTFDAAGQPRFGGPFFSFEKDSIKKPVQHRFFIEYKKEASALLNFVEEQDMILYDHLISETDEPDLPFTYVPDGDSEGFKWERGRWVHVDKVFDFKVDMKGADPYLGRPPMGDPLLNDKGGRNEEKLKQQSDKNKGKDKKKTGGG